MKSFQLTEHGRQVISDMFNEHKKYLKDNTESVDMDVFNQCSRLFKLFCHCWYGHLPDKNKVCKRCGKQL
jgi:hypothetical protein